MPSWCCGAGGKSLNQAFVLLTSENIRYELSWRVVGDIVVQRYQFLEGPVDCLPLSSVDKSPEVESRRRIKFPWL